MDVCCYASELLKHCGYEPEWDSGDEEYTCVKVLEPGAVYDVPLFVAYHCRIYMAPAQLGCVCHSTLQVF